MAPLATQVMPMGVSTAARISSQADVRQATVSIPMSSGREKGMSPAFSTMIPSTPPAASVFASAAPLA